MCSWFCETFCCFLLRCRDSYTPNTSTAYNNQSRNTNTESFDRTRDLEETGDIATAFQSSVRDDRVENEQPGLRPAMPPLGNSWQQGRNKPLPPMLPILKGTGFNYASNHSGIDAGKDETGMSASSVAHGRVDDALGDVGLYSVSPSSPALDTTQGRESKKPVDLRTEPILTLLKSSVLMNVFAASARSPGIFKSQPATPATAVFATFQFKEPTDRTSQIQSTEPSPDISPRTARSNGPSLTEKVTFSKFYSSSVARPFSGRTHYSGSAYRE
ncbi:hypothetical protein MMC26_002994 [Xylographa opegraphella]|nr:hypothetical protein [Xylographa opegraphella]